MLSLSRADNEPLPCFSLAIESPNFTKIHRHHKRTPYLANTFPIESYPWYCSDEGLFNYGAPLNPTGNSSSPTYWSLYTSPSNPFSPGGFNGTCQFPQITREGLDDSFQHGLDLRAVYHDLLGFLPASLGPSVTYRVTNNVITSQVASMVIAAMYAPAAPYPLAIQPSTIDSLEPTYSCPTASNLYTTLGPGSTSPPWLSHLTAASPLFTTLDAIANISASNAAFHMSLDHYFDNLSSRLCHSKPLPCELLGRQNTTNCVTSANADEVFRLGEYEYDFLYRSAGSWTLDAAVASYGVYIAELAANIRAAIAGTSAVKYRHNAAHDGSISRLLAILQVEVMVWPGMGAEVIFEIFGRQGEEGKYVRVLWGGQVLRSSNPGLSVLDMVPVENLLGYFEGLVGVGAAKVPGLCGV